MTEMQRQIGTKIIENLYAETCTITTAGTIHTRQLKKKYEPEYKTWKCKTIGRKWVFFHFVLGKYFLNMITRAQSIKKLW